LGYSTASRSPEKYAAFLRKASIQIASLTKIDAEKAAELKPTRADLLDALIAACVTRYDALVWTADKDFFKFLPKDKVRLI